MLEGFHTCNSTQTVCCRSQGRVVGRHLGGPRMWRQQQGDSSGYSSCSRSHGQEGVSGLSIAAAGDGAAGQGCFVC
jgi:hypothetical protein